MSGAGGRRGASGRGGSKRGGTGWGDAGRIEGGGVVAEEAGGGQGRRAYGVSSMHACDDGSRIAVRGENARDGDGRSPRQTAARQPRPIFIYVYIYILFLPSFCFI